MSSSSSNTITVTTNGSSSNYIFIHGNTDCWAPEPLDIVRSKIFDAIDRNIERVSKKYNKRRRGY